MKKRIVLAVVAILVLTAMVMSGCSAQQLAAKVGDRELTVREVANGFANSAAYASYYGYDITTEDGVEKYQDYIVESLISTLVSAYQAEQAGVTLTEEELESAKAAAQQNYDDTYQSFIDQAVNAGATDATAYANQLLTDALVQNGMTVAKLKKQLEQDAIDDALIAKHKDMLLESVQKTEDEMRAEFEATQAEQKKLFDEEPAVYFTYETYASYGYSDAPVYIPAGFFRVKHILVEDEQTAKDIKARIDAGEDFDALLKEFGTDPGMEDNEEGYLVGEGASFVEPFLNAALALANDGDVSEPVQSDYGWHIIKRVSTQPSKLISFDEVKDSYMVTKQAEIDTETYQEILQGWMDDASVVTRFTENYRSVGKENVVPAEETAAEGETIDEAAEAAE